MANAWGVSWGDAWGVSWGSGAAQPAPTPTPTVKRGAMYPGGWIPDRLYTPPKKKLKKRALKQLKELYEEAREVIPEREQVGLIPAAYQLASRPTNYLPAPALIDFALLARSLETIRVLIAAVEAAYEQKRLEEQERAKIAKRRKEEENLILLLAEIL